MENIVLQKIFNFLKAFITGFVVAALFGFSLYFIAIIIFFVCSLVCFIFKKKIKFENFWLFSMVAILGAAFFSFNVLFSYNVAERFDNETKTIFGSLRDVEYYDNKSICYLIRVKKIGKEKILVPFNVRIYANEKDEIDFNYFDDVKVKAKLNFFKNNKFKFFNSSISKKIFLSGRAKSKFEVFERNSFFGSFLKLRDGLIKNIDLFIEEPYNHLANGLLFGKSFEIPLKERRIVEKCGLSHMFAVSGLHIAILSIFIILILKLFKCPGLFCFFVLFFLMLVYALMVGFSPSVLRAFFMAFVVSFAMFFNIKIKPFNSLCFAAFVIFCINPMAIFGISFAMSFSSCIGLIFLRDRILNFILNRIKITNKILILFLEGFSASIAAVVPTSIILMFVFGKISILAPFVSSLVIPFVPLLFFSSFFVSIFGFFSENIASFFGYFFEGLFGFIFFILNQISKVPFCYIPTNYLFVRCIILGLLIFSVICFFISKKFILTKNFFSICFLIVLAPTSLNFILTKDITKIYVIGSGFSSNVVICKNFKTVVINCGGGENCGKKLLDFLDSKGILKVDVLICASSKKRHLNGVVDLLKEISPTCVILSKKARRSNVFDYIDLSRTRVIKNDIFHLEYSPLVLDVYNNENDFGVFINKNILYATTLNTLYKMSRKNPKMLAILDEKIEDLNELEGINFGQCIGLMNEYERSEKFEPIEKNKISEFVLYEDCRFKKGGI